MSSKLVTEFVADDSGLNAALKGNAKKVEDFAADANAKYKDFANVQRSTWTENMKLAGLFGQSNSAALKDATTSWTMILGPMRQFATGVGIGIGAIAAAGKALESLTAPAVAAEARWARLHAIVKATGYAAGMTASEMERSSKAAIAGTQFKSSDMAGANASLATFNNVRGETFTRAQAAVVDVGAALGRDPAAVAEQLGKALAEPIKAVEKLREAHVFLTPVQQEAIQRFVELGQTAKAQAVILAAVEATYKGAAKEMGKTVAGLDTQAEKNVGRVKAAIGESLMPLRKDWSEGWEALTERVANAAEQLRDATAGGKAAKQAREEQEAKEKAAAATRLQTEADEARAAALKRQAETWAALRKEEQTRRDDAAKGLLDQFRTPVSSMLEQKNALFVSGIRGPEAGRINTEIERRGLGDERTNVEKYRDALGQLDAAQKSAWGTGEAYERRLKMLKEQFGFTTPLEKHRAEIKRIDEEYEAGLIDADEYNRRLREINGNLPGGSDGLEEYAEQVERLKAAHADGAISLEDFNRRLASVKEATFAGAVDPLQGYLTKLEQLRKALKDGVLSQEEFNRAASALNGGETLSPMEKAAKDRKELDARFKASNAKPMSDEEYRRQNKAIEAAQAEIDRKRQTWGNSEKGKAILDAAQSQVDSRRAELKENNKAPAGGMSDEEYRRQKAKIDLDLANSTGVKQLYESTRTSEERAKAEIAKLDGMRKAGLIDEDLYERGVRQVSQQTTQPASYVGLQEQYKKIQASAATARPEDKIVAATERGAKAQEATKATLSELLAGIMGWMQANPQMVGTFG